MKESLEIAYIAEVSGIKMYEILSSYSEIFTQICQIRKNGLTLLENFAKANEIELKIGDDLPSFYPKNLDDALIFAINYENSLCYTYENLTDELKNDELKDIIFRLWATSNNEYIVALKEQLKSCLSQESTTNFIEKSQKDFANITQNLQDIISGKADKNAISNVLNHPQFSFFSGLALGAFGASLIAKNLEDTDEK